MARYSAEHKARTRQTILEAARAAFRAEGFDALSIDRLMEAAGLTRGAFYAHFESKEALVREVLRIEPGLLRNLRSLSDDPTGRRRAADEFDDYLAKSKRSDLIQCPLVAHPQDALRGDRTRKKLYGDQVGHLVEEVQRLLGGRDAGDRAVLTATLAVGAAVLAVSCAGPLADRVQRVARAEIRRVFTDRNE